MRILRVRFKNLNSLTGEWDIDLSHRAYLTDGLFAITGPTGAGKTTILDAICLGLYASTPRLNKISKGANEIMARRTGDCFAEVTFETQAGRYRCHWSQHRARRKPDGELQNPRYEIVEVSSGRILHTGMRDMEEQVAALTGMDFSRFTRSMLLAQGAFDTFLRAAPDERAPILEQITGTEIYSRISMRVHERQREERKRLDTLTAELAGTPLLSEQEEQHLTALLDERQRLDAELGRRLDQSRQAIAWLKALASLEQELSAIAEQWMTLGARRDAFEPERLRLERANRALELAGDHAALVALRAELARDSQAQAESQAQLPEREQALEQTEEAWRLAESALAQCQTEAARLTPILRQARELDLRLAEQAGPLRDAGDALAESEAALHRLAAKQQEDIRQLDQQRQTLDSLLRQLEASHADAALVEQLAGLRERFALLDQLQTQRRARAEDGRTLDDRIVAARLAWSTQAARLETLQREHETHEQALDQQRAELDAWLQGRTLGEWRDTAATAQARKAQLEQFGERTRAWMDGRRLRDEGDARQTALRHDQGLLSERLQVETDKAAGLERERALLETQLGLMRQIQGFEEARQHLVDGQPCPLCGATQHPFAEGNLPPHDATSDALEQTRTALKAAEDAIAQLRMRQAATFKELELLASRQREEAERSATQETQIAERRVALNLPDGPLDRLLETLPAHLSETQAHLDQATQILAQAETLTQALDRGREALEGLRAEVARLALETQEAAHRQQTAEQQRAGIEQDIAELDARWRTAQEEAQKAVAPHGIASLEETDPQPLLAELTRRRDHWQTLQKDKAECEGDIALLRSQTQQRAEQMTQLGQEIARQRIQLDERRHQRDALAEERQRLLPERQPDAEEQRLVGALEAARQRRDQTHGAQLDAARSLEQLKARLLELSGAIETDAARVQTAEAQFAQRLGVAGFTDESDLVRAALAEEARSELAQQAQQLADAQTELAARERDRRAQLASERQRALSEQPRAELEQAAEQLDGEQKSLHQEIGGLRQRLDDNQRLKLQQRERQTAIEAQRRECERWDGLHALIGSSDGKKYRNFAQGLTFDSLIGHANRQLQRMSERYLLIRDQVQPLELNVIDKDQAGVIRSAKNLSGGESFIVSLALALGLSRMASRKVRVDSLFLDEGFGTLDEEALETALETLAGLKRDGKLIGVISHVATLKERIGTQIQVTPTRGGQSRIQGPGCAGPV